MVASNHVHDFDMIRREYMRHVLDPNYPGLRDPSQDERWLDYYAVGNGLATYFPCSLVIVPSLRQVIRTSKSTSRINIDLGDALAMRMQRRH